MAKRPVEPGADKRTGGDPAAERLVRHLLVGQIGAPHGLRGEASIRVYSENRHRFSPGSALLVGPTPNQAKTFEVQGLRMHSGRALVKFSGIEDRPGAESVRGLLVFVETDQVGDPESGAYWEHELVGAHVANTKGLALGTVTGVEERLEQDIWQVETRAGQVLLPAARDIVVSVDLERKTIIVDPPIGLFPGAEHQWRAEPPTPPEKY